MIRKNIFETNSSSTHSLILNHTPYRKPKELRPISIETDRDFDYSTTSEKYTILLDMCNRTDKIEKLVSMLRELGVEDIILTCFEQPTGLVGVGYTSNYEIDDSDCEEYTNEILENINTLEQYLYDPSAVISGHDDNFDY